MTGADLLEYMETYAEQHKVLQHDPNPDDASKWAFVTASEEDQAADDIIKKCGKDFLMVLLPYEKTMLPVKADNYTWGKTVCFLVLKRMTKPSEREKFLAYSECEEICDDFCTRFIDDRTTLLNTINQESLYQKPVGPVSDNRYGMICMFQLEDWYDQTVKDSRWNG